MLNDKIPVVKLSYHLLSFVLKKIERFYLPFVCTNYFAHGFFIFT